MKKLLLFICLFILSQFILVAQQQEFIYGQVVNEGGFPIKSVDVVVDGQELTTNHEGAFVFQLPKGAKPQKVTASKKHYHLLRWSYSNHELIVILKAPLNLLEGQVVDARLKSIARAEVSILGSKIRPVYTNGQGYFTINLPANFKIKSNTKLLVNGYLIPSSDYTYSNIDKFVYIKRIDTQKRPIAHALANAPTQNVYSEQPTLHGIKISIDEEDYTLNKSGKLAVKIPNDDGTDFMVNAFELTEKDGKHIIEVHVQRSSTEKVTIQRYTGIEEFDKNINSFQREILREKSRRSRINDEIRHIAKQLESGDVDSIKRAGLERYLSYLEELLYESDSAYQDAKNDTQSLIAEIEMVLSEKDSLMNKRLNELAEAEILRKEAQAFREAAEKERDTIRNRLMVIVAITLAMVILTVMIYRDRHKIKRQKVLLENLNNELLSRNEEIEQLNSEMSSKNRQLEQKNEEVTVQAENLKLLNREITVKNDKITDSIRYAETIQRAILPAKELMDRELKEYFILYRPKDIVSGDFYWFYKISEQKYLIAAVDCTGHGVSGAFMSLIGNTILNEIVSDTKIHEPRAILEELDSRIRVALKQEQKINDDGMDVVLCLLEHQNNQSTKIQFTGAKRPLFYIEANQAEIQMLKGDVRSIGGGRKRRKKKKPFTNTKITLPKGSIIYLMSDGLVDQNGTDKPKIGTNVLKELLVDHADLPMHEQKELLREILHMHQGQAEQRDDITVIGFKI